MNLRDRVAALVEARNLLNLGLAPVLEKLKDISIPLEERWEAYTILVKNNILVENDIYGDGFLDILGDNLTLYDNFYIDRHETHTYIDMYDSIMEADGDYQKELVKARDENLVAWQEAVLASGDSSFTYDW